MNKLNQSLKICLFFLLLLSVFVQLSAQSNIGFKYQAVIRDAEGDALKEMTTDVRLSIHNDDGALIYAEVHTNVMTNAYGVLGLEVGTGFIENGIDSDFSEIDWGGDLYSLSVDLGSNEVNGEGWTFYGTSPILTVPVAMYAHTVGDKDDADADPENEMQNLSLVDNVLSISNGNSVTIDIEDTDEQILSLAGTNLSITGGNTVNLAPIINQEGDPSSTNEIQTLIIDGNTLSISGEGGNSIELPNQETIQTLELNGNELSISRGNSVRLNTIVTENKTDEIQSLEIDGNELTITGDGGNTITLPTNTEIQTIDYNPTNYKITLSNGGGEIDLSNLKDEGGTGTGTDDQDLNLNGTILEIEDGQDVDLQEFKQDLVYDAMTNELSITGGSTVTLIGTAGDPTDEIQEIEYDAANYRVRLSNGGGEIDLSNLKDATGTGTSTDDQTLSLNGTLLEIEDGNDVNLEDFHQEISFDVASQELSITDGNTILLPIVGGDPTDEIQELEYDAANYRVRLSNGGGEIDLSNLKDATGTGTGTDDQTLSLNGTLLEIEDGNDVDLEDFHQELSYDNASQELSITDGNTILLPIVGGDPTDEIQKLEIAGDQLTITGIGGNTITLPSGGSDNQNLENTTLSGTELIIGLERGGSVTVDLASLDNSGTDNQEITNAALDGDELVLEIEDGNEVRVDLSPLKTTVGGVNQQLSYDPSNNVLTLDDGGAPIDLSALAADTDATNEIQTLSIAGNQLTISGADGNTISLPSGPTAGSTGLLIDDDEDTQVYLREGTLDQIRFDVDGDSTLVLKLNPNGDPVLEMFSKIDISVDNDGKFKTRNTYVGEASGHNSTGGFNSFFGSLAGHNNTQGFGNNFQGAFAGYSNTTGAYNSFYGASSGRDILTGGNNSFFGANSGSELVGGEFNVGIGSNVINTSNEISENVVIGANAASELSGNRNVILGYGAAANTSGEGNIIIGTDAGGGTSLDRQLIIGQDRLIHGDMNNGSLTIGGSSPPTGSNSFAFGNRPEASGRFSFAGGNGAIASGQNSISLGNTNRASGDGSIAMGTSSAAGALNAIAIGNSVFTNGDNSFAIGYNSTVSENNGIALGSNNSVTGESGFVFGYANEMSGEEGGAIGFGNKVTSEEGGMAIGFDNESSNLGSFTFGIENKSSGIGSFSLGSLNEASGDFSLAQGTENRALREYSIAMGNSSTANFRWGIAIGDGVTSDGEHAVAMGNGTIAGGTNSFAIGGSAKTSGNAAVSMGLFTESNASFALSFGNRSRALGEGAFAGGIRNTAEGFSSVALGEENNATGFTAIAAGHNSTASSYGSIALGSDNTSSGQGSITLGSFNEATKDNSFAAGNSNKANGFYSVALGQNNTTTGQASVALGWNSESLNNSAIAIGTFATSSGLGSMALGNSVTASGSFSTAIGKNVSTNGHYGALIIGDGNELSNQTLSGADNQFVARFLNGYWFMTSSDQTRTGMFARAGANAWSGISDVNRKENFQYLNDVETFNKLSSVDFSSWNYKGQDPKTFRHYGIMAQDFYRLFGQDDFGKIGVDTLVNPLDMMGVSMSAIKGAALKISDIEKINEEQQLEIDLLKQKVAALIVKNEILNAQLEKNKSFEERLSEIESSLNRKVVEGKIVMTNELANRTKPK